MRRFARWRGVDGNWNKGDGIDWRGALEIKGREGGWEGIVWKYPGEGWADLAVGLV